MSEFVSTRGLRRPLTFAEAMLTGAAPDGGLLMLTSLPVWSETDIDDLREAPFVEVAQAIARRLFGDVLPGASLAGAIEQALDFPIALTQIDERQSALELFHGPTGAFKDVGARTLARVIAALDNPSRARLLVLVATSGDTGAAVASAFHRMPDAQVAIVYPEGRVSELQEAQMTTLGGNVRAFAVDGSFDDCQRMVKEALVSEELLARTRVTSANSINIGRLLPQVFYYAWASLAFPRGVRPTVAVPSGNYGNLTAGVLARQMGFPLGRLIAASTTNRAGAQFLAGGTYTPRASHQTLATAMDVGAPSNIERLQWLFARQPELREGVSASVHTDAEVRARIPELRSRTGYLCEPHAAIAQLALSKAQERSREPGIFLATAHPAKFREVVEPLTGEAVPLPPSFANALARPRHRARLARAVNRLVETLLP